MQRSPVIGHYEIVGDPHTRVATCYLAGVFGYTRQLFSCPEQQAKLKCALHSRANKFDGYRLRYSASDAWVPEWI